MIRNIFLRLVFLRQKLIHLGIVKFNGFTVNYAFPGSKIQIGKGTIINSGSLSNLVGMFQRTILIARYGGVISIGENCGISGATIYAMKEIMIGNNVLIGVNSRIIDNDFHPLDPIERQSNKPEDIKKKSVIIGNNCFIGMNCVILKGTNLGDNVVVGASSVVCGIFPDNVIIAGNPAKIIRFLNP